MTWLECLLTDLPYLSFRHPELVPDEIVAIQAMFDEAKSKGWLKK